MISTIVECTNSKLIQMKARYNPINQHKAGPTDYDEIQAFIGLLYVAGAQRSSNVHINDLWSVENLSSPFYSAVMSQNRFQILYRAIRFDDIETRQERCTTDNLAPIRDLFEKFVQHSVQNYSVSAFITVDKMFLINLQAVANFVNTFQTSPQNTASKSMPLWILRCIILII